MRLPEDQPPMWGWEGAHLDTGLDRFPGASRVECRVVAKDRRRWRQTDQAMQAFWWGSKVLARDC